MLFKRSRTSGASAGRIRLPMQPMSSRQGSPAKLAAEAAAAVAAKKAASGESTTSGGRNARGGGIKAVRPPTGGVAWEV